MLNDHVEGKFRTFSCQSLLRILKRGIINAAQHAKSCRAFARAKPNYNGRQGTSEGLLLIWQ